MSTDKISKIALWKLERGIAESDHPNSYTRKELIELFGPHFERKKPELIQKYRETFGEDYVGDIVEDLIMTNAKKRDLEKVAGDE